MNNINATIRFLEISSKALDSSTTNGSRIGVGLKRLQTAIVAITNHGNHGSEENTRTMKNRVDAKIRVCFSSERRSSGPIIAWSR